MRSKAIRVGPLAYGTRQEAISILVYKENKFKISFVLSKIMDLKPVLLCV